MVWDSERISSSWSSITHKLTIAQVPLPACPAVPVAEMMGGMKRRPVHREDAVRNRFQAERRGNSGS